MFIINVFQRRAKLNYYMFPLTCNLALALHSSALIGSRLHTCRTANGWKPGEKCEAVPESKVTSSKGIFALKKRQNVRAWLPGPVGRERPHSLRGEVLKPDTELAMKKSAICRRARRPVGLFPFSCCSWIRLSSSSLKAWEKEKTRFVKTTWK